MVVISDLLQQPRKKNVAEAASQLWSDPVWSFHEAALRSKRLAVVVIRVANPTRHHYRAFLPATSNETETATKHHASLAVSSRLFSVQLLRILRIQFL